jgi:RimJ/RimL family protein N-acetyltransferase
VRPVTTTASFSALLQPTLAGKSVELAPLCAADHDALYAVARDPLIWEQHPSWDRYKPEVFRPMFDSGLASGGALIVREVATGEVIGSTRFYDLRPQDPSVAIGYTFLARRCWGGTFNHEMKRLLLDHAFGFVDRVWFHIGAQNIRSRTAIGRIGALLSHEVTADPAFGDKDMAYYVIDRPSGG